MNKIVMGPLAAEEKWRDIMGVTLPKIKNVQDENIRNAMEELLFPFCNENDFLLLKNAMEIEFYEYLKRLGFSFLTIENKEEHLQKLSEVSLMLSPFGDCEEAAFLAKTYGLFYDRPNMAIIKKVNSKLYSNALREKLKLGNYGVELTTYHQLLEFLQQDSFEKQPYVLKESFGVSGGGNIVVNSEKIAKRLLHYFSKYPQGVYEFVAEPYFDKEKDFSCQMYIEKDGTVQVLATHEIRNKNGAYVGARKVDASFHKTLIAQGYYEIMHQICAELYQEGYYGDVCVDSMLCKDGKIVPVVEINVRKSMSLINYCLELFANEKGMHSSLYCIPIFYMGKKQYNAKWILDLLRDNKILYSGGAEEGVLLLSTQTIFANNEEGKKCKGRIYFSCFTKEENCGDSLYDRVAEIIKRSGF